ncbi:9747_t:CDS:1, partial [Dentiscutata heterogama]
MININEIPILYLVIAIISLPIIFYIFYLLCEKDSITAILSLLSILCVLGIIIFPIILLCLITPNVSFSKIEQYKDKVIYVPKLNNSTKEFECQSDSGSGTGSPQFTILGQISVFGAVAGLFFNVAVYGVTSKLDIRKTCIVDDFLILTCLILPIFSWFFTAKIDFEFFYDHNYPSYHVILFPSILIWMALFSIVISCYIVCSFHNIYLFPLNYFRKNIHKKDNNEKGEKEDKNNEKDEKGKIEDEKDEIYKIDIDNADKDENIKKVKKDQTDIDENNKFIKASSQKRFSFIKSILIFILFINSVAILIYDFFEIRYGADYKLSNDLAHINAIIDLEFLSFLTDIIYFILATLLIIVYFFAHYFKDSCEKAPEHNVMKKVYFIMNNAYENYKNSRKKSPKQESPEQESPEQESPEQESPKQKFPKHIVMKKVFFIVIFLSIIECFFEYNRFCTPKSIDTIFFFILSTVLTRSISSFFSHDKQIRVMDITKPGFYHTVPNNEKKKHKFVFLKLTDKEQVSAFLGKQRLYLKIKGDNDNDIKKNQEFIDKIKQIYLNFKIDNFDEEFYKNILDFCKQECTPELDKWLKKFGKQDSKSEQESKTNNYELIRAILFDLRKKELNVKTENLIAEKLMDCATIYVDILETGLFQYLIYSHRSYNKYDDEKNDFNEENLKEFKKFLQEIDLEAMKKKNDLEDGKDVMKKKNDLEDGKDVMKKHIDLEDGEDIMKKNIDLEDEEDVMKKHIDLEDGKDGMKKHIDLEDGEDVMKKNIMEKHIDKINDIRKKLGDFEIPTWH